MIEYIIQQVGNNEVITQSVRIDNKKYPPLALREFIANALIHQDFSVT
jgi:predicted HTH transcriptional regulator